jgi:hypothetical protein
MASMRKELGRGKPGAPKYVRVTVTPEEGLKARSRHGPYALEHDYSSGKEALDVRAGRCWLSG